MGAWPERIQALRKAALSIQAVDRRVRDLSGILRTMQRPDQRPRIMLVEISSDVGASVRGTLESQGYDVFESPTDEAARESIRRGETAIAICGAGKSSMELLSWAKLNFPTFRVILIAAFAYPVGMQDGFAVLLEPLRKEELMTAVSHFLHV